MSVTKIKQTRRKTKEKQRSDVSNIFTSPECSFVLKIRVVYFLVKHSYLCDKGIQSLIVQGPNTGAWTKFV